MIFNLSTLKPFSENIFNLADPDKWHCHIISYVSGYRVLVIEMSQDIGGTEDKYYVTFENLLYFAGPTAWKGANFRIGSMLDYFILLDKIEIDKKTDQLEIPTEETLSHPNIPGRIIILDATNMQLKLIAYSIILTLERPIYL